MPNEHYLQTREIVYQVHRLIISPMYMSLPGNVVLSYKIGTNWRFSASFCGDIDLHGFMLTLHL